MDQHSVISLHTQIQACGLPWGKHTQECEQLQSSQRLITSLRWYSSSTHVRLSLFLQHAVHNLNLYQCRSLITFLLYALLNLARPCHALPSLSCTHLGSFPSESEVYLSLHQFSYHNQSPDNSCNTTTCWNTELTHLEMPPSFTLPQRLQKLFWKEM